MRILNTIQSMGFGSMLGSGLLGLINSLYPELLHGDLNSALIVGALLGGGFHNFIDRWFINNFLYPIGKSIRHYTKLLELQMHRHIPKELKDHLYTEIVSDYFLGDKQEGKQNVKTLNE